MKLRQLPEPQPLLPLVAAEQALARTAALTPHQLFHAQQIGGERCGVEGFGALLLIVQPGAVVLQLVEEGVAQALVGRVQFPVAVARPEQQTHQDRHHAAHHRVERAVEHVVPVESHVARDHQKHDAGDPGCAQSALPTQGLKDRDHQHQ